MSIVVTNMTIGVTMIAAITTIAILIILTLSLNIIPSIITMTILAVLDSRCGATEAKRARKASSSGLDSCG